MQLNPRALACALGLSWGAAVFMVALAHLIWPGYGGAFLDLTSSIYPGFHPGGFAEVIVGTLYGIVDGVACGAIVAWIYNGVSRPAAG